jgi:hypothetical protein
MSGYSNPITKLVTDVEIQTEYYTVYQRCAYHDCKV